MTWTGATTVYGQRLATAGLTVTPPVKSISYGEPKDLTSNVVHIAYWWGGRRESNTGGNSFAKVNVEEALTTTVYIPDGVRIPSAIGTIEEYLRAIVDACHSALWGGWSLSGNVIGISVDDVTAEWQVLSGITARTATWVTWLDLAWVHDIVQ